MKKVIIILLILLVVSVPMASAQDEALPTCTAEEFSEFAIALGEAFAEVQEIGLGDMPAEPTAADLNAQVVLIDAFSYGYWEGFYEAEISCAEASWLGTVVGLTLDELLIVTQLSTLTVHEAEAGNADVADALLELAIAREAALEANAETIGTTITGLMSGELELDFELAACSDDELEATYEGLDEIVAAYEELGELTEVAEGSDFSVLIGAYATLSNGYWGEFVPVVPMCYEAQDEALFVGLIIDESLIIVSNLRLAEFADDETAEVLLESAMTRLDDLTAIIEMYYGEEE